MADLDWQMFAVLSGIFVAWNAFLVAIIRYFIVRSVAGMDKKFDDIESDMEKEAERRRELENRLHSLETDLPNRFVQREDWIRFSSVIDKKMDKLNEKLDGIKDWVHARSGL